VNDAIRNTLTYRFGVFEARCASRQLFRQGTRVRLQDQPFQLLLLLLERPGEMLSREELRQRLWAAGTFVDFDNSLKVAVKKLRDAIGDDADNPRFVETVPRMGYRFIAPLVIQDGLDPVANEAEATGALRRVVEEPTPSAPRRRAHWKVAAGLAIVAAAAFGLWQHSRDARAKAVLAPSPAVTPRRSIAVLGFRNTTGRSDGEWLSTSIAEMLSTELAAGNHLRLISGEQVASLKRTAEWSQADSLAQETTRRLGTALGSSLLVTGSYVLVGPGPGSQLRLDARIQDAESGRILAEVAESGLQRELFPLVQSAGNRLRQELSVPNASVEQLAGVRASVSGNLDAQRFYSVGLEKLRGYDALTARDLLQQAVKLDPKFPMAHWALANAWNALGYDKNAEVEAGKGFANSNQLPAPEKLLIEGFYRETQSRWKDAASAYRSLTALFPDSVDYGLRLFRAQRLSGDQMAAQETINRLRRLPQPESDDPRIDLNEARIAAGTDRSKAVILAQTAVRKSQVLGLKLEYAHAREEECVDLGWAGRPQEALSACNEAKAIFLAAGDRHEAALTAWQIADRAQDQAQYPEALASYQEALADLQESGSRANISAVLNNSALVYEALGDLARARKMYEKAAQLDRETGELSNLTVVMGNVASIRARTGDLDGALKVAKDALGTARSTSTEGFVVGCLNTLAALQQMAGNLKDARQLAEESVRLERRIGEVVDMTAALSVMGNILQAEGDVAGARRNYDESLALSQHSKDANGVAGLQLLLAGLDMDEGQAAQAEPLVRGALQEFANEKAASRMMRAQLELARNLLMQSKTSAAEKVAQDARVSAQKVHEFEPTLDLAVLQAEIGAVSSQAGWGNHASPDLGKLQTRIADARRKHYFEAAARAQLVLGKIRMRTNPVSAQSMFRELAGSCRARGYSAVADKASAQSAN